MPWQGCLSLLECLSHSNPNHGFADPVGVFFHQPERGMNLRQGADVRYDLPETVPPFAQQPNRGLDVVVRCGSAGAR